MVPLHRTGVAGKVSRPGLVWASVVVMAVALVVRSVSVQLAVLEARMEARFRNAWRRCIKWTEGLT
jgi:hypothetical protein